MGKIAPSAMLATMSGSAGDRVVARTRGGLASRSKPKYKYPKIAAVQEGNARLKAANAAWNAMSVAQAEAWNRYAATLAPKTGFDGTRYATTGKNELVALATKFMQANPERPVPLDPPRGTYVGPNAVVAVQAGSSSLVFAASSPVGTGTVVELLVQRLPSPKRSPVRFYKSAAFASFGVGHLSVAIPVQAGWYAAAYRFVEKATGRSTMLMPLGKVEAV